MLKFKVGMQIIHVGWSIKFIDDVCVVLYTTTSILMGILIILIVYVFFKNLCFFLYFHEDDGLDDTDPDRCETINLFDVVRLSF